MFDLFNPGPYSAKNLKSFATDDGDAYNYTLYRDGKKVAEVRHEGMGGCPLIRFLATTETQRKADEDALKRHAATYPPLTGYGMTIPFDADLFVDKLFERVKEVQRLDRRSAKGACFWHDGMQDDEYGSFAKCTLEQARAYLRKHHAAQNPQVYVKGKGWEAI